jgi:RNA recognition motif-containing protein
MAVKLFVGGLSFSTSSERLRAVFAGFGTVESVTVATDRDTGRSRGFGFVEMASASEATAAIARLNGTDLDGRQIRVEMSSSTGRTGAPPRRSGGGGGGGGRGRW